ncbi:MAG: PTS galactosamine transporter subunit IIB [Erysipelotrichaceae bacterium]|nr:PTS galactosamine transporter subunit IIB [Erysipelotrichaceae bacterium]
MAEPNIVLTRVDNRLVHGQVGCQWVGICNPNLIIVADDVAATDTIQQSLMKMTSDSMGVGIRFFTLQKTIEVIHNASPKQRIFIVVRTPSGALKLIENNVPIKSLNIGNMHFSEGKRVHEEPHVYVDDQDLADFEAIKKLGTEVYIQIAPGDKKYFL